MKTRALGISLLLSCSGVTALVVQVAWMREFRLVFGASSAASAAVVAIFMGGLGLGNALLGRRADRVRSPLAMYALLELGVGASAAVSPFLIDLARAIYVALGGQSVLGLAGATLVRLGLSAVVLAVPTILMGGTLPAAVRAGTPADDERRRSAGWLYGANTLGAVVGAAASTFLLLPGLGTRTTLWLGCSLSLAVAASAWALSRKLSPAASPGQSEADTTPVVAGLLTEPPERPRVSLSAARSGDASETARRGRETHAERERNERGTKKRTRGERAAALTPSLSPASGRGELRPQWVYVAAAVVGFAFFLMELVWYRMLGPILAGTTYTFGLILAVALLGIGIGGALYAPIFRRARPSVRAFALSCGLEAAFIALPFALGDRLALLAARYHEASHSFGQSVWGWAVVAGIVILPAAIVSGVQFPLLIALLGRGDREVGRQVGFAFAWNTVGAILGSLAGGFGALPLLTAPGTWIAVVLLLACLALAATACSLRSEERSAALAAPLAMAAVAIVLVRMPGPTAVWRHSGIGAGRFALPEGDANVLHDWMNAQRRHVVWQADGVEASIGLVADDGLSFFINGKCDGNAVDDAGTQLVSGVFAAMLHPRPKTAFIVGLGTGETPGWLAEVPSIERVDVVELEPAVDQMAKLCVNVNHDVLHNPKVNMIYDDAREVLLTIPTRYDLIFSEPSNPWRAGIANLFTREFYRSCRDRLTQDGLFVQWVQGYEIDEQTVRTIFATLDSVFDHVEVWQSKPEDMLLVCSQRPVEHNVESLKERVDGEPYRSALAAGWQVTGIAGFLSRYVTGPPLVDEWARQEQGRINTDDHNVIEYGFARTVGNRSAGFSIRRLRSEAVKMGADRPPLVGGDVDWDRVVGTRQILYTLFDRDTTAPPNATREQRARSQVLAHYWKADMQGAVDAWKSAGYEPIFPSETRLLALACAQIGDDRAQDLIEQLRPLDPLNADALEAYSHWRRGDIRRATTSLERTFRRLRTAPWGFRHVFELLFDVAVDVSRRDPSQAPRLYNALGETFDVYAYEEQRLTAVQSVAIQVGMPAVLSTLAAFEPNIPWNETFLTRRLRAYEIAASPLEGQAREDLATFQQTNKRTEESRVSNRLTTKF